MRVRSIDGRTVPVAHRPTTNKEINLSYYIVKFFKTVINNTGHETEACQGSVETLAVDSAEAAAFAKHRFCEAQHLRDWSLHADRIEILEADFPS